MRPGRAAALPGVAPAGAALLGAALIAGCAITPQQAFDRVDRLVEIATAQWRLWGEQRVRDAADGGLCALLDGEECVPVDDGCGRELSSRYCELVNRYWPVVSDYRHPCAITDVCVARRPAGVEPIHTEPWSAAFVSYVYRQAGFGRLRFAFSDTHADYVTATRDGRMPDFELIATPFAPRRGDLLCAARGRGRDLPPSAIHLIAHKAIGTAFTPMHCDLVVGVDPARRVATLIGGNVAQAVSLREIALDADGLVHWAPAPQPGWLLALRLRAAWPPGPHGRGEMPAQW